MGIIRDTINRDKHFLYHYGFEYGKGAKGEVGFVNTYSHSDDSQYLWVTINFTKRIVYLYNEYECGGLLWEREIDIPDDVDIYNENEFIDWLEEIIDIND